MSQGPFGLPTEALSIGLLVIVAALYVTFRFRHQLFPEQSQVPSTPAPPVAGETGAGHPATRLSPADRAIAGFRRLLGRPGWKAFFIPRGDDLHVILAAEAAPPRSFLHGEARILAANALMRGDYRRVILQRLRANGTLSEGIDLTDATARVAGKTQALDYAFARYAAPAELRVSGRPVNLARDELEQARQRWPDLAPLFTTLDYVLEDKAIAAFRRLLERGDRQAFFVPVGESLEILLADRTAPHARWLTGRAQSHLAPALGRRAYRRFRIKRLRANGSVSQGIDVTHAATALGRRSGSPDLDFAAFARPTALDAPSVMTPTLKAELAQARAALPELAPFLGSAEVLAQALSLFTPALTRPGWRTCASWRGDTLELILAADGAPQAPYLASRSLAEIADRAAAGLFTRLTVRKLRSSGRLGREIDASRWLPISCAPAEAAEAWLKKVCDGGPPAATDYFEYLQLLRREPALIDFIYPAYTTIRARAQPGSAADRPPFDRPDLLPAKAAPQPKRRSVVFLHNNYYHFNNLTHALRQRGWDAMTVSLLSPDAGDRQFMHGEDLNLFDADPTTMADRTREFFRAVPERFGAVHFTGQGMGSFFPANFEASATPAQIPWDFMELRRSGVIVGYTPSGCNDGPRQTSIREAGQGVCGRCVWENRPDVCSDAKNGAWARKLESLCDWTGLEGDWAVDERVGPRHVKRPVVMALDCQAWRPDIVPPEDMRITREPGEILIYHAVGNYEVRRAAGRDIKGTGAVMAAIDRLKAEGFPVRPIFATKVPSTLVRYLQVQTDIVVDQLNYGRHGANARECMMLGKPVVARVIADQGYPLPPLAYLEQSPAIRADEDSVYEVLKDLIQAPETWAAIGARSRAFAEQWHDAHKCALRFERIIDRIEAGLIPEDDAVFA